MNAGVTEKAVLYSCSRFSWELSEIRAAKPDGARLLREAPAAFRRLCVETLFCLVFLLWFLCQPPSGGCVLKLSLPECSVVDQMPAAFRRLCVETTSSSSSGSGAGPAAFRRLCVETPFLNHSIHPMNQPPSGGCVLKHVHRHSGVDIILTSRLQAAVC